jgi:hypothetical protein
MNPHYKSLYDALDLFSTEGTGTQLINILVEYLCEEPRWLVDNISTVDAERLVKLAKLIEEKFRK